MYDIELKTCLVELQQFGKNRHNKTVCSFYLAKSELSR